MRRLRVIDRKGPEHFSQILKFQNGLVDAKINNRSLPDFLVLVEHEKIYTRGRASEPLIPAHPAAKAIEQIEVNRGGQHTFHGPGQLVAYPIFDLDRHGSDVHLFLRTLELATIRALETFGIQGRQNSGLTGVWVERAGSLKKLASIGIGVKKWISFHGLALNVSTNLNYFRSISPCGLDSDVMTSMQELLPNASLEAENAMESVKSAIVEAFIEAFDLSCASMSAYPAESREARPNWLKVKAPGSEGFMSTRKVVKTHRLATVCEEAICPNIAECWAHSTATFMIMGELCTRRCSFCSVKDGSLDNLKPLDPLEPYRISKAVKNLGLRHVVITCVNRDDLPDMGANHFYATARSIALENPDCMIELLISDLRGRRHLLETILRDKYVGVLNHNIETVSRLYRTIRPGSNFERSLNILKWARELDPILPTKSSIMLGLGETRTEVLAAMDALREVDCNILTLGQYLQPTPKQSPVEEYITPAEFVDYQEEGFRRGFSHVESGPFVRSSYHAWKHVQTKLDKRFLRESQAGL
ncbi:MAG: lipoyl synthase [Deltaproteobacteria bacterium]|nr:lipoyl synthase [Deltaproteobacteria bacterium]